MVVRRNSVKSRVAARDGGRPDAARPCHAVGVAVAWRDHAGVLAPRSEPFQTLAPGERVPRNLMRVMPP